MARLRRDDQVDLGVRASRRDRQTVIARAAIRPGRRSAPASPRPRRSPPSSSRMCHSTPPCGRPGQTPAPGSGSSWSTIGPGQARTAPRSRSSSSAVGGLFRVGRQAERRDQPGQRFLIGLVPDAERIDMIGRDADQTGDAAESVEPAHRRSALSGRDQIKGGAGRCDRRRAAAPVGAIQQAFRRAARPSSGTASSPKLASSNSRAPSPRRHSRRSAAGPSRRNVAARPDAGETRHDRARAAAAAAGGSGRARCGAARARAPTSRAGTPRSCSRRSRRGCGRCAAASPNSGIARIRACAPRAPLRPAPARNRRRT